MCSESASDYKLSCCYGLPLAKCKENSLYEGPFEVTAASEIPPALQNIFKISYLEERT